MKRKKIILFSASVLVLAAGWYGYAEYNRKNNDMAIASADLSILAPDLIKKFETDEGAANKNFLKKRDFVVAVTGIVKEVIKDEKGYYTVVLGDTSAMSSVRCAMDSAHQEESGIVKRGDSVTIQGAITGFNKDELLGSDVILNRCAVNNKNN